MIISADRPRNWRKRLRKGSSSFPVELWPALQETFIIESIKKGWATGSAEVALSFSPAEERPFFQSLTDGRIPLIHQRGKHPRHWIPNTMDDGQLLGFEPVVLMLANVPALPMAALRDALDALSARETDAIVGTGSDGLFLIGLPSSRPSLFKGLRCEGPEFAERLMANIDKAGLNVIQLGDTKAVSDPDGAEEMLEAIEADPGSWRKLAPVTVRFLARQGLVKPPPRPEGEEEEGDDTSSE